MNWLSPLTALYAGAVAVPLLLLLYFLKLKRQEKIVSSTLLWKRAVQDLQVNAPFQRLRRSILLLLQLLAMLLFLTALAGPVLSLHSTQERYVLLIDNSASMNAVDVKPSRLAAAKQQAALFVTSLTEKSFMSMGHKLPRVMIISLNDNAKVVCNFTSDTNQLLAAIEQIQPTDGRTSLEQGLELARAFCQTSDSETAPKAAEPAARLVLFSDGRIRDVQNLTVMADEMVYHKIGESTDNVAMTAMTARRSFEKAEQVNVFAAITNYNESEVTTDIELSINGDLKSIRSITVPGRSIDPVSEEESPGQNNVDFEISSLESGVIELRLLREDALAVDNSAWSVISPPADVKVLLVSDGSPVLESALQACRQIKLFTCTKPQFSQMDQQMLEVTRPYDIIVLDNHDGSVLGRGHYLVFGKPPAGTGIETVGEKSNQLVIDYREKHPVLRYVNLDNLFVAKCHEMKLPRDVEVLAEFDQTPAIALARKGSSICLLAGFDVLDSNWPFEPGFVLFMYNSIAFLAENAGLSEKAEFAVAEPVMLQGLQGGMEGTLTGPGYENEKMNVTNDGNLRLPVLERAGLYSLAFPQTESRVLAVNMLDAQESDIRPVEELVLSGENLTAEQSAAKRFNLPVWPHIVAVVLLLVCLEWFVYNSKVRI